MTASEAAAVLERARKDAEQDLRFAIGAEIDAKKQLRNAEANRAEVQQQIAAIDRALDALRKDDTP